MRLGLLADIHEETNLLRAAIKRLRYEGVDRFVTLGDVFETGQHLEETIKILYEIQPLAVWGNHDFGLCRDVSDWTRNRFPESVLEFFADYKPELEIDGCLFRHIEPHLNAESLEDLWGYGGEGELEPALALAAVPHRRVFMGHLHRWAVLTAEAELDWDRSTPFQFGRETRYLVVVHAVQQGQCAIYNTALDVLTPFDVSG